MILSLFSCVYLPSEYFPWSTNCLWNFSPLKKLGCLFIIIECSAFITYSGTSPVSDVWFTKTLSQFVAFFIFLTISKKRLVNIYEVKIFTFFPPMAHVLLLLVLCPAISSHLAFSGLPGPSPPFRETARLCPSYPFAPSLQNWSLKTHSRKSAGQQ